MDPRLAVFASDRQPELFHGVVHDAWEPDPYDVPEIHAEARQVFDRLVTRAATDASTGRILLLWGASGAGKTHLMRSLRHSLHRTERGLFAYFQMTSSLDAYDRYVLRKLVESLQRPYFAPRAETTGLRRISDALRDRLPEERRGALSPEAEAGPPTRVAELSDELLDTLRDPELDAEVVRALLYLQLDRPSVTRRVIQFLRAEPLSPYDLDQLPGIGREPRDPLELVHHLRRLIHRVLGCPLVVCADQLEDMYNLGDAERRFPRVIDVLRDVSEAPGTVVVLSCLEAYYTKFRASLNHSAIQRLELDPEPIRLVAHRSPEEARRLIARRLRVLYEAHGVAFDEAEPLYPFPEGFLEAVAQQTTRRVLNDCLQYREACVDAGERVPFTPPAPTAPSPPPADPGPPAPDPGPLQQAWNDASTEAVAVPDEPETLERVLAGALAASAEELRGAPPVAVEVEDPGIRVSIGGAPPARWLVALCDRDPISGGGLARELARAQAQASPDPCVVVRSTAFPSNPKTKAAQRLGQILAAGGRRVVVEDADWRHMLAMARFREAHAADPGFATFLAQDRPLSRLPAIRAILGLGQDRPATAAPPPPPPSPSPSPPPVAVPPEAEGDALLLGHAPGKPPPPVHLDMGLVTRHLALLGGTGSGKTTTAMMLIEKLLARGIGALLLDRKGDLCGYADPAVWEKPSGDPARDAFRAWLAPRVDVALYTPGHGGGRSLEVPLLPAASRDAHEQQLAVRMAAESLGDALGYTTKGTAAHKRAVLLLTLEYLAEVEADGRVTLPVLEEALGDRHEALLDKLGNLADYLDKVSLDVQSFAAQRGPLFGQGAEPLDAGALLGRGAAGKTRLSIVSTKFLGPKEVQFWVTQLLLEIGRWASAHPAPALQAVLMIDEADIYLPALGEPPTKKPLMGLLRRARSAGLGLVLATQSPGDFDYRARENLRTWLVGRLQGGDTALRKLKPLLADAHTDGRHLSAQGPGEFHLLAEGRATRLRSERSAVQLPSQLSDDEILRLASP